MRDNKIIGMFNTMKQGLEQLEKHQVSTTQMTSQAIRNIESRTQFIIIYLNSLMDYLSKWWFIPIGFFPGNKIFAKIYNSNIKKYQDDMKKRQEEAIQAQKEKMNENKEVSDKNEGRADKQVDVNSASDQS